MIARGARVGAVAATATALVVASLSACGSRDALLVSERTVARPDAGDASTACPVRARPRLNPIGTAISVPAPAVCPGRPAPLEAPCTGQCGNGAIDECTLTQNALETCDGVMLGGVTCEALGFSGGQLACDPTCRFDPRACVDCANNDHVSVCQHADVGDAPLSTLALATHDDRVAAAGFTLGPDGIARGLRVVVFDSNLERVREPSCIDFDSPLYVALAATADGFVLAVSSPKMLITYALSLDGVLQAATRMDGAYGPVLIESADSGPLLLFYDMSVWSAALLDSKATLLWSVPIFGAPGEPQVGNVALNGVYADRGFLVSDAGDYVERVEMDGSVTCLHRLTRDARSTELGSAGTQVNAVWVSGDFSSPTLRWARLDRDGARKGDPIAITTGEGGPLSRASLPNGTTLVVSRGPMLQPSASNAYLPLIAYRLDATWIDGSRAVLGASTPLVTNGFGSTTPVLARLGTDVVAGWLGQAVLPREQGPAWLTLARLHP